MSASVKYLLTQIKRNTLMYLLILLVSFSLIPSRGHSISWISFEDTEISSTFGFTTEERGGSYGMTQDIDITSDHSLFGDNAAYLSESWDRVSLPLDISEGIVNIWFFDDGYGSKNDGTETLSNALRLRSNEDDPNKGDGWPLEFLAVDLKGEFSGMGRSGYMPYYTVAKNGIAGEGMGVDFIYPVASTEQFDRNTSTWHLATFLLDSGKTFVSIDNQMGDVAKITSLTKLELLCRSGWYQTRPGTAKIMLWDGISISPKINSTDFSSIPSFMQFNSSTGLQYAAEPTVQSIPFQPLPGSTTLARFPGAGQTMSCPWNCAEGDIELWFWDNIADEGGNPDNGSIDVTVADSLNSDSVFRMRTYESVMGQKIDVWYLVSPESPAGGMGQTSLTLSRATGWNRLVFHKHDNCLWISLNGHLIQEDGYRWNNPPENMTFSIASRSGSYADGNPVWLGRLMVAGRDGNTAVSNWELYQ